MSQENVELVGRLIGIWNRTDWDAAEPFTAPDVVMVGPEGWPESETSYGWDASVAQLERLVDPWEVQRVDLVGLKDVGDRVLAEVRWITEGKDSGIPLETDGAALCTVRDGKLSRVEFYLDLDKARHAAGLSE
jgi:ketosteroid isomerase-like protein